MPTTPLHALRYPASTDPADVVADLLKLATDVDNALGSLPAGGAPAGIVSGEAAVWNGSAWVRSSVTKLGIASLAGYPSSGARLLAGDGTWKTIGPGPTRQILIAASGTYTRPANVVAILVECIAAGGGGGGVGGTAANTCGAGGGGGGGAYAASLITNPAATYAYAVGVGGNAGAPPLNGITGTDTSFGATLVVARAGTGATNIGPVIPVAAGSGGAAGGSASTSTGDLKLEGGSGSFGLCLTLGQVLGGMGGAGARGGGMTIPSGSTGAGPPGTYPGGGGGGGVAGANSPNRSGGQGANGVIIVTEFYVPVA